MSIALKLEPRWPEPARLTATSAFSAAHVGEQARDRRRARVRTRARVGMSVSSPRMLPQHVLVHVGSPARDRSGSSDTPSAISGTAVVSSSRQGTSSTSTSRMRTFGIAAHHWAEMNVARWL